MTDKTDIGISSDPIALEAHRSACSLKHPHIFLADGTWQVWCASKLQGNELHDAMMKIESLNKNRETREMTMVDVSTEALFAGVLAVANSIGPNCRRKVLEAMVRVGNHSEA